MSPLTFHFDCDISSSSSILNCVIVGPQSRKYLKVMTDLYRTIFLNQNEQVIASIDWVQYGQPVVHIDDIVQPQAVNNWIKLNSDRTLRTMTANGRKYIWDRRGDTFCLYPAAWNAVELFVKTTRRNNAVTLEITREALQAGLLEMAIVATVLLQCGRLD